MEKKKAQTNDMHQRVMLIRVAGGSTHNVAHQMGNSSIPPNSRIVNGFLI